jgi:hypothetical protein
MKIFGYELIIEKKEVYVRKGIHPDYKKAIEFVFTIEGEDYYAFKTIADAPKGRYLKSSEFMAELEMRITRDMLLAYCERMEELINQGNFGKVAAIVEEIKYRAETMIETETMYRLASSVFFTMDEDLTTYDYDYNSEKITKFKKYKSINDFFLKEPVKRFIPLPGISEEDLAVFLKLSQVRAKYSEYLMQ